MSDVKVTYTSSMDDWAAAQAHYLETWPGFRQNILFWRSTIAFAAGTIAVAASTDWPDWARAVLGVSVVLALYAWYPRYVRQTHLSRAATQLNRKDARPFLIGPRVVEVSDEGLRVESPVGHQLMRWGFITAVDVCATHVFVRFRYGLNLPIPNCAMTAAEKDTLIAGMRARIANQ